MTRRPAALTAALAMVTAGLLVAGGPAPATASTAGEGDPRAWTWWKTDLHAHSVVSGDGTGDPGIIAEGAAARGYNAVFLTDHQAASYNPIGGVIASHAAFEDDTGVNRQWDDEPTTPTSTASAGLSTEQVLSGTGSYKAAVSAPGEAFGWLKRGPTLHTGAITLRFSAFPAVIQPGAGLYVSMSLGGDPTIPEREPNGYTSADGVVHPGRSTTLVWQLGTPRVASDDGTTRVITQSLAYTAGQWNSYTIDVSAAIDEAFPDPATRPDDLNALLYLKMAAASRTGGAATGYFDAYNLDAADAPTKSADAAAAAAADFVRLNSRLARHETATFRLMPGQEMGFNDHAQNLRFPITDASAWQQFTKGVQGIPAVQAAGYPAMLNHPGFPGGVTEAEFRDNLAYGADLMEAVERGTNDLMVRQFDALLSTGEPIVGTWTSDAHRMNTFGPTTHLQAPVLEADSLLQSAYEGRAFLAAVDFPGTVSLSPDQRGGSYPARYPLYRSASSELLPVRLSISGGLEPGWHVVWLRDGVAVRTDMADGPTYDQTALLPLPDETTPVRAEVRRPDGSRVLMTEALMMRTVADLPRGVTAHVERVRTPSGTGYTRAVVRGLTGVAYDSTTRVLTTTTSNPAGSQVQQVITSAADTPTAVTVDGSPLAQAASRAALDSTGADGWAFEPSTRELVVQSTSSSATSSVAITLEAGTDSTPPTDPVVTALAEDARNVSLRWTASEDASGVSAYLVRRNGVTVSTHGPETTSWRDSTVQPDTDYVYEVVAQDVAAHQSGPGSASVRTQPVTVTTLAPAMDTYVTSTSPSSAFGSAKLMKADASPEVLSYVRFSAPPPGLRTLTATLQTTSTAALPSGIQVRAVADHTWNEATLTYATRPASGGPLLGSSGPLTAGVASSTALDVSELAPGDPIDLALVNPSPTNVSLYTKENGSGAPRLVLESSTVAPALAATSLTVVEDSTLAFVPGASGGNGTPLQCSLLSPPTHGTAWVAPDCSAAELSPAPDYIGPDAVQLEVTDGTQRVSATLPVTVTAANDPPFADEEELGAGTDEDVPVTVTLRGDDPDGDCPLRFEVVEAPQQGTLGPLASPLCASGSATTTATYTPASNANGSDAFSYRITDPRGATSLPVALSIVVAAVNDAPTASPVAFEAAAAATTSWQPAAADVDNGALTCSVTSQPSEGTAGVAPNCSSGTFTAGPSLGTQTFTYQVTDGISSATGTVTVDVTADVLFQEGFETGNLARWTRAVGAAVTTTTPRTGTFALDLDATAGGPAYVRQTLTAPEPTLELRTGLRTVALPTSGATALLRLRAADDTALLTVQSDAAGRLRLRNEITRTVWSSTTTVAPGTWHELLLAATPVPGGYDVSVRRDGVLVLGVTTDLGGRQPAVVQLGDNARGPTGRWLFDDVTVARP